MMTLLFALPLVACVGVLLWLVLHVRQQLPHGHAAEGDPTVVAAEQALRRSVQNASGLQGELEMIRARRQRDEH